MLLHDLAHSPGRLRRNKGLLRDPEVKRIRFVQPEFLGIRGVRLLGHVEELEVAGHGFETVYEDALLAQLRFPRQRQHRRPGSLRPALQEALGHVADEAGGHGDVGQAVAARDPCARAGARHGRAAAGAVATQDLHRAHGSVTPVQVAGLGRGLAAYVADLGVLLNWPALGDGCELLPHLRHDAHAVALPEQRRHLQVHAGLVIYPDDLPHRAHDEDGQPDMLVGK